MPPARPLARPPAHRRLAAWYITGPLGHLVGGALDTLELLARMLWLRARGRRVEWFE
jgi:hypothetical protein